MNIHWILRSFSTVLLFVLLNLGRASTPANDVRLVAGGSWPGYSNHSIPDIVTLNDVAYLAQPDNSTILVADLSDHAHPRILRSIPLSIPVSQLAIANGRLYGADQVTRIVCFDLSDPKNPSKLSQINRNIFGRIVARGNFVFALTVLGLQSIDFTNPTAPKASTSVGFGFQDADAAFVDNVLFVTGETENAFRGLLAVDVSTPAAPVVLRSYTNSEDVAYFSLAASGTDLFISAIEGGDERIEVFDASNPKALSRRGELSVGATMRRLRVSGNSLAGLGYDGRSFLFDVSNRNLPQLKDNPRVITGVTALDFAGGYFLSADSDPLLTLFDVMNLAAPTVLGELPTAPPLTRPKISGTNAYARLPDGIVAQFDVANLNAPAFASRQITDFSSVLDFEIVGNYAYFCAAGDLWVVDWSTPAFPAKKFGPAIRVVASRNRAFTRSTNGLQIYSIASPANPVLLGAIQLPEIDPSGAELAVFGDLVFASRAGGYCVVDAANPSNPTLLCSKDTSEEITGISASGQLLALRQSARIVFNDLSDPAEPVQVGAYPVYADAFCLRSNILLVASAERLDAIDISNINSPTLNSSIQIGSSVSGIALDNSRIILTTLNNGIISARLESIPARPPAFVDAPMSKSVLRYDSVSLEVRATGSGPLRYQWFHNGVPVENSDANQAVLTLMQAKPGDAGAYTVAVSNDLGTVTNSPAADLKVVTPLTPAAVEAWPLSGAPALGVRVAAGFAYIRDPVSIGVYDLHDPKKPTLAGHVNATGAVHGFEINTNIGVVIEGTTLRTIDLSNPPFPSELGSLDVGVPLTTFKIRENIACIGTERGLTLVDLADARHPRFVSELNLGVPVQEVGFGRRFAIARYDYSVQIVDLSDFANPKLDGTLGDIDRVTGVAAFEQYAVTTTISGMWGIFWANCFIYDVSNPAAPALIASDYAYHESYHSPNIAEGKLFLFSEYSKVKIYDFTHPAGLVQLGTPFLSNDMGDTPTEIAVSGNQVYAINSSNELTLIDLDAGPPIGISVDADWIVINWPAFRGGVYQLQKAIDLRAPNWQNVGDPISPGAASPRVPVPKSEGFFRMQVLAR